jgi:hypothetical protein
MTKNEEIVKAPGTLATVMPEYLQKYAGDHRGTEDLKQEDLQLPRLALAQGLSPQLQEGDPLYIDSLKIGDIFNTVTGQVYGKGPLYFTVIRRDPMRAVEFFPRKDGGGIKDFNVSPTDARCQWTTGPNGERIKPLATQFYDYVIALLPSQEIAAFSLKNSGLKIGKQFNSLLKLRNAPTFTGQYTLRSVTQKNSKGTWAVYQFQNAGWVEAAVAQWAEQQFEAIKNRTIAVEVDTDDAAVDAEVSSEL